MNKISAFYSENQDFDGTEWEVIENVLDKHLAEYIGKSPIICQIGSASKAVVEMWNYYFDNDVKMIFLDENPMSRQLESDDVVVVYGREGDANTYTELMASADSPDIIIDAGRHLNKNQKASFSTLFEWMAKGGVYVVTGTNTSYITSYGGGLDETSSFVEHAFTIVDRMHASHVRCDTASSRKTSIEDYYTSNVESISFHDSVVVIEKVIDAKKKVQVERLKALTAAEKKRKIRRSSPKLSTDVDGSKGTVTLNDATSIESSLSDANLIVMGSRRKSVVISESENMTKEIPSTTPDTVDEDNESDLGSEVSVTSVEVKKKKKNKLKNLFRRRSKKSSDSS